MTRRLLQTKRADASLIKYFSQPWSYYALIRIITIENFVLHDIEGKQLHSKSQNEYVECVVHKKFSSYVEKEIKHAHNISAFNVLHSALLLFSGLCFRRDEDVMNQWQCEFRGQIRALRQWLMSMEMRLPPLDPRVSLVYCLSVFYAQYFFFFCGKHFKHTPRCCHPLFPTCNPLC